MASASSARKCDRLRRVQTPASASPKTGAAGNVSITVALISVSPSIGTDVSRENVTKEVNERVPLRATRKRQCGRRAELPRMKGRKRMTTRITKSLVLGLLIATFFATLSGRLRCFHLAGD